MAIAGLFEEFSSWSMAMALVFLFLLSWLILRFFSSRLLRSRNLHSLRIETPSPNGNPSMGICSIISDDDLRNFMRDLEGTFNGETWENVVEKKNGLVFYSAKCCRPRDGGPLKYLSFTRFEKCCTELLRDFYMDNEYRKQWDKTVIFHNQLQVNEISGTEVGRTIKKFPLFTPREYVLAWRVWEGHDKTFYCFIKDCEHPLAPWQKKFVRVQNYRSGWRIRKVPGNDACEITMVHQEDAGMNIEMAKMAFSRGIWNYMCKMNHALREYSSRNRSRSASVASMRKLIQKVPSGWEAEAGSTSQGLSGGSVARQSVRVDASSGVETISRKSSKKWIRRLLVIGGIVCLSRGQPSLGTSLAMACILKKITKQSPASGQVTPTPALQSRGERGRRG
ncbi:phosphatidylcholine transfer protein-like isoform X1 [Dioscorea cayenensis subsp. rotundata]|uniref:Phosphatidylcholine transfer protein-like isoform X1 n=1 Tax=Dioscorea cayennensis subsp. rotundata TaxID=55577 RepID=A0AB40B0I0_DIOCR|nr:phosphatidylcholine transfer protein-like isoform X1 [Dioscorea cayenensis subsp. rotundata]